MWYSKLKSAVKFNCPLWLFLGSIPVCFFGHGFFSNLTIKHYIRSDESALETFFSFYQLSWEYAWVRVSLFIVVAVIIPVFVSLWLITKRLASNKPKRVFYVTIPILSFLYIFLRSVGVIAVLIVGAPEGLSHSFLPAIVLIPFSFVFVWLLTVTLFLYRKSQKIGALTLQK